MQRLSPETPLIEFTRKSSSTSTSLTSTSSRSLLVLASQHGDEPCGVLAVNRLLQDPSWPFVSEKEDGGCAFDRVSFALGNPRAFRSDSRQIEENLNRCFALESDLAAIARDRSSYERQRAGELATLLAGADAVLDLHSASAPSPPFAMFPPASPASASLARALFGVPYALRDFTGRGLGLAIEWAAKHGSKRGKGGESAAAVTLEAGQHASAASVEASVSAILAALRWRGVGEGEKEENPAEKRCRPRFVTVRRGEVVRKGFCWETEDGMPPEAFARFALGELVASDDVRGELRCEVDGGARIVLPAAKPVEGEDAFLWGEEEEEEEEEEEQEGEEKEGQGEAAAS
jgi:predicted deacylase